MTMYRIVLDINDEPMIMNLRERVFCGEQGVSFEDEHDSNENDFIHLCKSVDDCLIAYARVSLKEPAHIGRVVVDKLYRGNGHGRDIMNFAERIVLSNNLNELHLNAQLQAKDFYNKLGYIEYGPIFLDAGIEHVAMKKLLKS